MKRRTFIKNSAGITAALSLPLLASCHGDQKETWACTHNSTPLDTKITVKGLEKPVNVLQISDSHITYSDESDQPYEIYSTRMTNGYLQVRHFKTLDPITTIESFEELMELAKKEKVDLVALTGDILNFPSATAVAKVQEMVSASGIPYKYISGNHDWHYEGMEGSDEGLRQKWCTDRLMPLYQGSNPLYSSQIVGGINMVFIDDSTYQVNEEQLEFYKQQKARPEPIAVFVHIPLYMPTIEICCGHPQWGAAADHLYEIERRERWSENGNKPSTIEFVKQVMSTERLLGIFAGHTHQCRFVSDQGKFQYITGPSFNGQYRMIRFLPS